MNHHLLLYCSTISVTHTILVKLKVKVKFVWSSRGGRKSSQIFLHIFVTSPCSFQLDVHASDSEGHGEVRLNRPHHCQLSCHHQISQVKMNLKFLILVKASSSCGPRDAEDEGDGEVVTKHALCNLSCYGDENDSRVSLEVIINPDQGTKIPLTRQRRWLDGCEVRDQQEHAVSCCVMQSIPPCFRSSSDICLPRYVVEFRLFIVVN